MALVTVTQLRQHVESDLVDDAVQRLIDDADGEILARLGSLTTFTHIEAGAGGFIQLTRKASSITSIVERQIDTDYTLGSDDYALLGNGYTIQRRNGSTYPSSYFKGLVTVVAVPADETASRVRLEIDLVRLALVYTAQASTSVGDASVQSLNEYQAERESLFRALLSRGRLNLA